MDIRKGCSSCCAYFSCRQPKKKRMKDGVNALMVNSDGFSSGESDCEFVQVFTYLSTDEKTKRILHLWRRCILKLKGAVMMVNKIDDLRWKV